MKGPLAAGIHGAGYFFFFAPFSTVNTTLFFLGRLTPLVPRQIFPLRVRLSPLPMGHLLSYQVAFKR
jgi:hypothetical protein